MDTRATVARAQGQGKGLRWHVVGENGLLSSPFFPFRDPRQASCLPFRVARSFLMFSVLLSRSMLISVLGSASMWLSWMVTSLDML